MYVKLQVWHSNKRPREFLRSWVACDHGNNLTKKSVWHKVLHASNHFLNHTNIPCKFSHNNSRQQLVSSNCGNEKIDQAKPPSKQSQCNSTVTAPRDNEKAYYNYYDAIRKVFTYTRSHLHNLAQCSNYQIARLVFLSQPHFAQIHHKYV